MARGVPAIGLALAACLAWGCSDFLAGLKSRQLAVLWVLLVSQGSGLLLVLVAAGASGDSLPGATGIVWAVAAGVAELVGFAAFYRALAVGAMTIASPISGLAALVPVAVGVASGQAPTLLQGLGITIALGGATLAAVEPGADGHSRKVAAGISLAAVAAVAFGAFF